MFSGHPVYWVSIYRLQESLSNLSLNLYFYFLLNFIFFYFKFGLKLVIYCIIQLGKYIALLFLWKSKYLRLKIRFWYVITKWIENVNSFNNKLWMHNYLYSIALRSTYPLFNSPPWELPSDSYSLLFKLTNLLKRRNGADGTLFQFNVPKYLVIYTETSSVVSFPILCRQ